MSVLELDEYEVANLAWLLRLADTTSLNTGDWLRQILARVEAMPGAKEPANETDRMRLTVTVEYVK